MNDTFRGQVVLVTGAGKGIGRLIAEAFAGQGAVVAANDISPVNLDETAAHINAAGGRVKIYVEDIAKKMPIQALLNQVLDDWERMDILINAAEVEPLKTVLEMDDWDWQRTLDVNLTGAFLLTQSAGRIMKQKGRGVIVHIGARLKHPGVKDDPKTDVDFLSRRAAYFSSKAGLAALARSADAELSGLGIRVHFVDPEEPGEVVARVLSLCA